VERLRLSTLSRRPRRVPPGFAALGSRGAINGLAVGFGLAFLAYLATGQWLWLALLLVLASVGVDRVLRSHPAGQFRGVTATAIYLFVPVLFALGSALFFQEVARGWWNVLAATAAAAGFRAAVSNEYLTVDASPETYPAARAALSILSYLTAFALFTVVFISDLPLAPATLVVMLTALLLTVDNLREMEVETGTLFAYAAGVAAVLGELRLAMYFLPPGDLVAGGLLLIAFYPLTGLTQSYLGGQLDRRTIVEYAIVAGVGLAVIAVCWVVVRSA
jgi:hypothetical protein